MRMTSGAPVSSVLEDVAALGGVGDLGRVEHRQVLPRQREARPGRSVFSSDGAPAHRGLVGVGRADDVEAGDGAQRGQVLDRLVGGAVAAEADRVVRPDEDRRQLHQRGQPDRRAHVVAEDQEGAAVDAGAAVQRDAVDDRAHGVLADAEVQRAAVRAAGPHLGLVLGRDEARLALHRGVVALGEVGRAAPQLGQHVGASAVSTLPRRPCGWRSRSACRPSRSGTRQRLGPARRAACGSRSRSSSAARSGLPAAQASKRLCHCGVRLAAAVDHLRGRARAPRRVDVEGARPGRSRGSPWSARSRRRRARSRGPCRCSACVGAGQPMIVRTAMSDGRSVTALAASIACLERRRRPRRSRRAATCQP